MRVEALMAQAVALQRQGRAAGAIEAWRALLAQRPDHADAWYELGYLLRSQGEFDAALQAYERALALGVRDAHEVHLNRAVIYTDHLRRDADAERELQAALKLKADYRPALLNLGNLQEERGDRGQALQSYQRMLALPARSAGDADLDDEAMARVAQLTPAESDAQAAAMDQRLEQALRRPSASAHARACLHFARGRLAERRGQIPQALASFGQGKQWSRHGLPAHDRQACERQFAALQSVFAVPAVKAPVASRVSMAEPLFICGMFRSGSTLVEQVLAAHPQMLAAGELEWLPRLVSGAQAPFPQRAAELDAAAMAALARAYRAHLQRLFSERLADARYVSDKRPDNFLLIGLIKQMFPSARIVHTVRNPLDTGLSIYMQHLNAAALSYANELGDIGHYIGQYQKLMAHWKQLYPADIHDFDYDRFIEAPRESLASLLDFLGLPWSESCLEFHRLNNTVKTASYWQVRRPLYREASGRWRRYGDALNPLREALLAAGVSLPPEHDHD
ncbi:MAG: sulfotransferase [Inhella sp.]